jgi:hypothetical protein
MIESLQHVLGAVKEAAIPGIRKRKLKHVIPNMRNAVVN